MRDRSAVFRRREVLGGLVGARELRSHATRIRPRLICQRFRLLRSTARSPVSWVSPNATCAGFLPENESEKRAPSTLKRN
jgi:hypothetical protein